MQKGDLMAIRLRVPKIKISKKYLIQNIRLFGVGIFVTLFGMLGIFGVYIAPKCGSCGWKLTILQLLTEEQANYYIGNFWIIPLALILCSCIWYYVGKNVRN